MGTFVAIFSAVLGGGLLKYAVEVLTTPWRLRVERKAGEHVNASTRHAEATDTYAAPAAQMLMDIESITFQVLGPERGLHDTVGAHRGEDVLRLAHDAVEIDTTLRARHPTKSVREKAAALRDEMLGFYYNPDPNNIGDWPSHRDREDLLKHERLAEELLEEILTPIEVAGTDGSAPEVQQRRRWRLR